MSLNEFMQYELAKPQSWSEMKKYIFRKNVREVDSTDIKASTTLKQLLPSGNCGVVILFLKQPHEKTLEDKKRDKAGEPNVGHFCLLFRHKRSGVHFFDPLGVGLRTVIEKTGANSNLVKILSAAHVNQNKVKFQERRDDVQSCGRHCAMRYNMAYMKPAEYATFMRHKKLSFDEAVLLLTLSNDLTNWEAVHKKVGGSLQTSLQTFWDSISYNGANPFVGT